jgi:hypothetical protein
VNLRVMCLVRLNLPIFPVIAYPDILEHDERKEPCIASMGTAIPQGFSFLLGHTSKMSGRRIGQDNLVCWGIFFLMVC